MELKRLLGQYSTGKPGALFIALGGIHGNEPAGLQAFFRVFNDLKQRKVDFKGEFIGIAGNLRAIQEKRRFIDKDLNRQWTAENIQRVRSTPRRDLEQNEDQQQRELMVLFERLKSQRANNAPIVLMDMHTTSAKGGVPFAIANDSSLSQQLAMNLGIPVITGVESIVKGTTLNYFSELNLTAFAFEAGQHDNPASIDRIEAAIWITLYKNGCLSNADIPNFQNHQNLLMKLGSKTPRMVQFAYRHPVKPEDEFTMKPGFKNFMHVQNGDLLAHDRSGEIRAKESGLILMPLYQKQGEDGFFIVQAVNQSISTSYVIET